MGAAAWQDPPRLCCHGGHEGFLSLLLLVMLPLLLLEQWVLLCMAGSTLGTVVMHMVSVHHA
jgi:hypothetical protein